MNRNKRALAERSHLLFQFPQPNGRAYLVYLPFLENCQITENKRSNLAEYPLLSRSSPLYAYMGSKARTVNLKFNITFLNVLDYISTEGLDDKFRQHFTLFFANKESQKKAFFILNSPTGPLLIPNAQGLSKVGKGMDHAKIHRKYYQNIAKINVPGLTIFDDVISSFTNLLGSPLETEDDRYNNLNKVIDLIIFWINLVRSTTTNNSSNTTLGPPIVKLTHGPMYNNVPFVVDSYNIRIMDESGYDVQTMLPKQIEISLSMNEVRVGNFGDFKATKVFDGDNNVGWEAVLSDNTMDPYNGAIS